MAIYRVLQSGDYREYGVVVHKRKGELITLDSRSEAERYLASGRVGPWQRSSVIRATVGEPAPAFAKTKRVGIWQKTTHHYSGGRILLYQYALTLAANGIEVFLITDKHPRWSTDYPANDRVRVLIEGQDRIPPDIDIVLTDSKSSQGKRALQWAQANPLSKFVCFNFETANWAAEFHPALSRRMENVSDVYKHADYLIACSHESAKYLRRAMESVGAGDIPIGVFEPGSNLFALDRCEASGWEPPSRPFAVYSARKTDYKLPDVALEAIMALDTPFDLVAFGGDPITAEESDLHRVYPLKNADDATKFKAFKHAHVTIAPSLFEGYGMVPGESLTAGTPAIVFDLPVLRQVYGRDLIYVPFKDVPAFKRTVADVCSKPKVEIDTARARAKYGMDRLTVQAERLSYHSFKRHSITAQLICYWGFCPESIEAIYPYVDQIEVAYGPVQQVVDRGVPPDGSLEHLQAFPDPEGKINIEARDVWADKLSMREWCAKRATGNYMLVLDGDEVWTGFREWIDADIPFGTPRWVNFWHSPEHWVHDKSKDEGATRWGQQLFPYGSVCPMYRWSWWRPTYRFRSHPIAVDANNEALHRVVNEAAIRVPQTVIYHLGHALPRSVMEAKHQFYKDRDGGSQYADLRLERRRCCWHDWNGEEGDCGDGIVHRVDWEIPSIVRRALNTVAEMETIRC